MISEMDDGQQPVMLSWPERIRSLKNLPPVLKMVWQAAPGLLASSLVFRLLAAALPITMLGVTRKIIDSIYVITSRHSSVPRGFWLLVALEFILAGMGVVLARLIDFSENVLSERYVHFVNINIMRHAATLDLTSYEDPQFYDKLERARVQGADRSGLIQSSGQLLQEFIATVTLAAGVYLISPWILCALITFVVPAFLGETHFAFLGYSLSVSQTPARRELDYLRLLGASKESAKEQRLFGLGPFFVGRYTDVSDKLYRQKVILGRRRLMVGSLLSLLGTIGYYATYAFGIHETITGVLTLGTLTFLAGAIAGASSNIQALFSTFSHIADHALFVSDLIEFFSVRPKVASKTKLPAGSTSDCAGIRVQECFVQLSGKIQAGTGERQFSTGAGGKDCTGRSERPGQDDDREAADEAVRRDLGADSIGWQ